MTHVGYYQEKRSPEVGKPEPETHHTVHYVLSQTHTDTETRTREHAHQKQRSAINNDLKYEPCARNHITTRCDDSNAVNHQRCAVCRRFVLRCQHLNPLSMQSRPILECTAFASWVRTNARSSRGACITDGFLGHLFHWKRRQTKQSTTTLPG